MHRCTYFGQPPAGSFLSIALSMACSNVPLNGSSTLAFGPDPDLLAGFRLAGFGTREIVRRCRARCNLN